MVATATTTASAVAEYFQGLVDTADSTNTPLMNLIPGVNTPGDNAYNWAVMYGDNASNATLADGGTFSAAGNALYADATISYAGALRQTVYALTGTARDFAKGGNFDPMKTEMLSAIRAHNRGTEEAHVTALVAAIDSAGSYGGLLRSTYKLASYEAGLAGADIALSDLAAMDEALRADPVDADMSRNVILSAVDRRNEYLAVAVGTGAGDARITPSAQDLIDAGLTEHSTAYNGKRWYDISTMTAGTVLELDLANVKRNIIRPVTIEPLAKTTDADTFAITSHEVIAVINTRKCGKLTLDV